MSLTYFPWAQIGPGDAAYEAETFALSPDGMSAVLILPTYIEHRIWRYDFDTGSFTALTPAVPMVNGRYGQSAEVSGNLGKVAFVTTEALVAADIDGSGRDVYVADTATGAFNLIEVAGLPRNAHTELGAISDDGRWVVVLDGVVPGSFRGATLAATSGSAQVNLTARLAAAGIDITRTEVTNAALDADGSVVVLRLETGEHIVYDRATDLLSRLSDRAEGLVFDTGTNARLTADGTQLFLHVADGFDEKPSGLVRVDLQSGEVTYVYTTRGDTQENFDISDNGRYVVFTTTQGGLVPEDPADDGQIEADVFVRDMLTGDLTMIGREDGYGLASRFNLPLPQLSGDGTRLMLSANLIDERDEVGAENYGSVFHVDGYGSWLPAVLGDGGPNLLTGTAGDDVMRGLGGNDTLRGFTGNDTIDGGEGADTIDGGGGHDLLTGGPDGPLATDLADVIYGAAGNDTIRGGAGNDALHGGTGDDLVEGGYGADTVFGNEGNDTLTGSALGDVLFGGDGFDFINGGFGHDRVNGGNGGDRFYHQGVVGHGSDWIQDFSDAEGDVLVYGGAGSVGNFQVNFTETPTAGQAGVDEAFVIYKPSGQILWALVDGGAQGSIDIVIGGQTFDLLA